MSTNPSNQIAVFVNAGAKAISLTPCDAKVDVDIRVNVATGVSAWFATTILGKATADQQGSPKYIRWNVDVSTLVPHTTQEGKDILILDLRDPQDLEEWVDTVAPLATTKGTAAPTTAAVLRRLTTKWGNATAPAMDDSANAEPF